MKEFKNKKILFIGPVFYGYQNEIIDSLKKMGFIVTFFAEKDYSLKPRVLRNINKNLIKTYNSLYLYKLYKKIKKRDFDYIFVIRGEILTPWFMKKLRNKYFNAKFIMYQWDSIKNNNYLDIKEYFDKVYSFERSDSSKYVDIIYQPLFYTKQYKNISMINNVEQDIDILFIASGYLGRGLFAQKIYNICEKYNIKFYHHIYRSRLEYLKSRLKGIKLLNIKFNSLSNAEIIDLYKRSRVIIDLNHENQTGLTIRTFEALGAGKKLITTNEKIKLEPFYDKNNIMIIDRNKPILDIDFIKKDICFHNKYIGEYYIDNWLLNILKVV